MPKFEPSPPALIERFDAVVVRRGDVERRKMFGYPALFVGGNLVSGLFADGWMIRLAPDDLTDLLALPGSTPFAPMPGRTMTGYALLPPDVVADDAAIDAWLDRAVAHGRTLKPK
jgi:TfoX/Sxy family transcriptional regulator of competence genes